MKTIGGYEADEVISALQESIRRGLEEDALYWATELDLSDQSKYLWERLLVIASEDVGMANNQVVRALNNIWTKFRDGQDTRSRRLFLVHAVMLLTRAEKSRQVDHATICMYGVKTGVGKPYDPEQRKRLWRPVPDYAKDKHTLVGRMMRRGFRHFFDVAAKLAHRGFEDDPYEERARELCLATSDVPEDKDFLGFMSGPGRERS